MRTIIKIINFTERVHTNTLQTKAFTVVTFWAVYLFLFIMTKDYTVPPLNTQLCFIGSSFGLGSSRKYRVLHTTKMLSGYAMNDASCGG